MKFICEVTIIDRSSLRYISISRGRHVVTLNFPKRLPEQRCMLLKDLLPYKSKNVLRMTVLLSPPLKFALRSCSIGGI